MAEKFLDICKTDPIISKRIKDNPELIDSVVEIYIGTQIERLLNMRNADGKGGGYGGPQQALFSKMFGTRFSTHMARVLGPYAYTNDEKYALAEGLFEVGERFRHLSCTGRDSRSL